MSQVQVLRRGPPTRQQGNAIPFTWHPVEVDITGPKALQARLTGSDDMITEQASIIRPRAHGGRNLARQQNSNANIAGKGKTILNDVQDRTSANAFS